MRSKNELDGEGMRRHIIWNLLFIAVVSVSNQGCVSTPQRLSAVPTEITAKAAIPGMPGVRFVAGGDITEFQKATIAAQAREQAHLASQGVTGGLPRAVFLAVSGGGDNGAFSAGLLNGWTESGTRPEFKLVTGISTGALIAPFAFLGTKYDATLKEVYTTISPKDVLKTRSLLAGVFGDAMADNAPLWTLTRKSVDAEFLKEIAAEYAKGRFLLIGTADLDARRPIIWDMGKIASYGDQKALDLFISIMIASASIPAGFPPVMIDVEADGKHYQEMHVDGGTMSQVFVYPVGLSAAKMKSATGVTRDRSLYVIRNARLDPEWAQVERKTMSIAGRAVGSLIHTQGIGDLFRIYAAAQRDGVDFNLAFIPSTFNAPHKEEFDNAYMRELYDVGHDMALQGFPWLKTPPAFGAESAPARASE